MTFPSIRIEGAILSGELLDKLDKGDFTGQRPADFGIDSQGKLKDEIVRAWTAGQAFYTAFQHKLASVKEGAPATAETRNQWIIPLLGLLGYAELEFQSQSELVGDKPFRLSHRLRSHGGFTVHIVGARESLDKKPATGQRVSPHGHLQEYLNLKDYLYGIVTNGKVLRLLRNSTRLIKLSYVEFDLDRMFSEELFADFSVLYRLLHVTRLPRSPEKSAESLLERYHQDAIESGARIRDGLSFAVEQVIQELGSGFLARNESLQAAIANNSVTPRDLHYALLRLIYRLLLLMVAEERGLLFAEAATSRQRKLYLDFYSIARLRRLAEHRALADSAKHDLWRGLRSTFRLFETEGPGGPLGLTGLGGHLFSASALGPLQSAELDNGTLLSALAKLSLFRQPDTGQLSRVNYGALATEEFGSVYERLLELHPVINPGVGNLPPTFGFKQAAGNERKTTGSYYTPSSLVECLLDSALDPVLEDRLKNFAKLGYKSADEAVLALKVCDPACGSGHFLIAAAQRIARRLALLRSKGDEPSVSELRHTLREVISHCIYGVDINPMSVELCKVALWLEAMEAGKPLSFLDHHIRCGNSLLGATPELIAKGIPDDAFTAIEGDDKKACSTLKKLNARERAGFGELFALEDRATFDRLQQAAVAVENLPDDSVRAVEQKSAAFEQLQHNYDLQKATELANLWCAAFVIRKRMADESLLANGESAAASQPKTETAAPSSEQAGLFGETFAAPAAKEKKSGKATAASSLAEAIGITTGHLRNFTKGAGWPVGLEEEIRRLSVEYNFFHWYLGFPEVFQNNGFDVILGNPPWERTAFEAVPYFVSRVPEIANAETTAKREALIAELPEKKPEVWKLYQKDLRLAEGSDCFYYNSGIYRFSASGRTNTFALFTEVALQTTRSEGRVGLILPSALATDIPYSAFWGDIVENRALVSMFDFENRGVFFPNVHRSYKFSLFTFCPVADASISSLFGFFLSDASEVASADKIFTLQQADVAAINPVTKLLPVCRTPKDFLLLVKLHKRGCLLMSEASPWVGLTSSATSEEWVFNTDDKHPQQAFVPMWEAKCIHQFNHRHATYLGTTREAKLDGEPSLFRNAANPEITIVSRYHVPASVWSHHLSGRQSFCSGACGYRDVARSTDERTVIAAIVPFAGFMQPLNGISHELPEKLLRLVGCLNSFVMDFAGRQKTPGTHVNVTICKQLPIISENYYSSIDVVCSDNAKDWISKRVLELTYTAWDLEAFAQDCGWSGPPFRWDEERRFQLRCELDAAFFHLYGLNRDDTAYILDTFPIVKRKDEEKFGTYRTKETILALYDALAECQRTGKAFVSVLNPPPADARCCHPPREATTAPVEPIEVSRLPSRQIAQTSSTSKRPTSMPPRERISSPDLEGAVVRFDFTFPSKPRPHIATTAELFTLLLPALVQEAGGQLDYKEFLEAMSFFANPPKSSATLPPTASSQFSKWRVNFPSSLVDANALKAALHDHIVMRQTLGMISDGSNFVLFKGVRWVDMKLDWLLFDARLALAHAVKTQSVDPPWARPVAERDLQAWVTA